MLSVKWKDNIKSYKYDTLRQFYLKKKKIVLNHRLNKENPVLTLFCQSGANKGVSKNFLFFWHVFNLPQENIMLYSPEWYKENQNLTFTKRGLKSISSWWPLQVERSNTSNGHQEDINFSPTFGQCCISTRLCRVNIQGTMVKPERQDHCDSDFGFSLWHSGLYGLYVSTGPCMLWSSTDASKQVNLLTVSE